MTAPLKLDCRQTRDAVNALGDFLMERRNVAHAHAGFIRDDLDRARGLVTEIDRAADRRPQIGMLMPVGTTADALVAAFGGVRVGAPLGLFAGGAVRLPVLTGLIAPSAASSGGSLGLAARVRLSRDDASASARAGDTVGRMMGATEEMPRRTPDSGIRIEILSLGDIIAVLARAYCAHITAHGAAPSIAEITTVLNRTERSEVTAAAQAGLTAHHVANLRAYLEQRFRDHPRLGALAAAGYWEAFATLAPRATVDGRRRLASLLWGGLGDFDIVYSELAGAVERLNHATDIIGPPDAVRTAAASGAGWGDAHPYSILSAETLLSDHEAAGELIEVRTRFGQPIAVSRNILTALTREVTLSIDSDPTALLAGADLVQLPVACPDVVPRGATAPPPALATGRLGRNAPWLPRALLQAKTLFLAETAVSRMDLTGLILHLDEGHSLPGQFAALIADWIEQTQGQTPQAREATDTTLFVAVDAPAAATPLAALETFLGTSRLAHWFDRWGTDRAFDNLFILAAERRETPVALADPTARLPHLRTRGGGTALATRGALADSLGTGQWLKHVRDATVAVEEAMHASDGGIAYLAQSVAAIDYGRARRRQLGARLAAIRSELVDTIDRFLYASAPDAEHDWRHRAALATQARLRTCADEHRLGHLIAALCPSERECAWLFERIAMQDAPGDDGLLHRLAAIERQNGSSDGQMAARYARRIMTHWFTCMRLTEHAVAGPQAFGFTQATFGHLIEELAVAAIRTGADARIAAGVARGLGHADLSQGSIPRTAAAAAKVASDVIGGFLSNLGYDQPWSSRHPRRRGTLQAPLFERIAAVSAVDLATIQAERITSQFHADWCEGFGHMTEENVTASRGMRFEDSEFRELAELRALLGTNSRERTS